MNRTIRTAFFVSAFAPAVLIGVGIQVFEFGVQSALLYWLVAGLLGCILPFLVVAAIARKSELLPFDAKKVESQDWLLVVFVVTYFLPLITRISDLSIFAVILIASAVLLASIEAIPCHPLLHIFNYHFYKVEGANGMVYTMISRRKILSAGDIKMVRQISTQMLMEK